MSILKKCSKCKEAKSKGEFYKSKCHSDGLYPYCKDCKRRKQRAVSRRWYWENMEGSRTSPNYDWESRKEYYRKKRKESPNAFRAVDAVNRAVQGGKIPSPSELPCSDCGGRAHDYHHKGYDKERWFDIVPLCRPCHGIVRRIS